MIAQNQQIISDSPPPLRLASLLLAKTDGSSSRCLLALLVVFWIYSSILSDSTSGLVILSAGCWIGASWLVFLCRPPCCCRACLADWLLLYMQLLVRFLKNALPQQRLNNALYSSLILLPFFLFASILLFLQLLFLAEQIGIAVGIFFNMQIFYAARCLGRQSSVFFFSAPIKSSNITSSASASARKNNSPCASSPGWMPCTNARSSSGWAAATISSHKQLRDYLAGQQPTQARREGIAQQVTCSNHLIIAYRSSFKNNW